MQGKESPGPASLGQPNRGLSLAAMPPWHAEHEMNQAACCNHMKTAARSQMLQLCNPDNKEEGEEATSPCFAPGRRKKTQILGSRVFGRTNSEKFSPTVNCYFYVCCPMLARAQKSHQHWNLPAPLMTATVTRNVATSKSPSPCAKKDLMRLEKSNEG